MSAEPLTGEARQAPASILVIRLSALGDVVMASGLISALRDLYPRARLSWLTEPAAFPLLRDNRRLDEVLVWPRGEWQRLWRERRWRELRTEYRAFRALLQSRRFDLVLDAQGLLKSGLCAWWTGAPRRVGLLSREGSSWLMHEEVRPPAGADIRLGAEYRFLARYLGAKDQSFSLNLEVGAAAQERARLVLGESGAEGRAVALCPFTTRPQKHWFEERWIELARALRAHGLSPLVLGGPADEEAGARLMAAVPGLVSLAGRLRLDESAAVIAHASLLIGVDTGLTHMGTALSIPTVALFGSTRPYLDAASPSTVVMYDALPCSPCRRHPTCGGAFTCMRDLTVARVLQTALALLHAPRRQVIPIQAS